LYVIIRPSRISVNIGHSIELILGLLIIIHHLETICKVRVNFGLINSFDGHARRKVEWVFMQAAVRLCTCSQLGEHDNVETEVVVVHQELQWQKERQSLLTVVLGHHCRHKRVEKERTALVLYSRDALGVAVVLLLSKENDRLTRAVQPSKYTRHGLIIDGGVDVLEGVAVMVVGLVAELAHEVFTLGVIGVALLNDNRQLELVAKVCT